jgi:TonB-dependent receptor
MSRKSRRNTLKNAAEAKHRLALRVPYSTLGLSGLALGSMAFTGALHAQDAATAKDANGSAAKPKATSSNQQSKSLRSKLTRLAASGTLPANGAGLVAQATNQGATAADQAQTTAAAPATARADQLQEIVVTGIRGSLQRSLQIKKLSLGIVDAVSAEDIGQFPDSNIGEAVARIPGVTVDRGTVTTPMESSGSPTATGAVQGISVRGFGSNFETILEEGRQIASGNGQTFNFSDLSANYVGEIDVLKTPDMSLSSGDVGATINVKFPNPFDNPGFHAQVFGQEDDNENDGGVRPSFGALLSDTFDDGKLGILIDGDYLDDHITTHHEDIVGWEGTYLGCSSLAQNFTTAFGSTGCASTASGAAGNSKVPSWFPQEMAMYLERIDSMRRDARASVQWHPTDAVLVTLDDNYSADDEHDERWSRSTWFGSFPDATLDGNGTITDFTIPGAPQDFNAFVGDNYITTNTPGINVVWNVNDSWSAELDADQSLSKYNPNNGYTDVDSDVGFGDVLNNYAGGLVVPSGSQQVPYWSAYGPGAAVPGATAPPTAAGVTAADYDGLNPFIIGSHVVPIQDQQNTDQINQAKLDATWQGSSTKVNFGAQFTDDLWNTKEMDTLVNNYWELWGGYGPASGQTGSGVALPPSLFSTTKIGTWMPGYSSQLPNNLVIYNPYAVINYLETQPIDAGWAPQNGAPAYTSGTFPLLTLKPAQVQHVSRTTYSPFVTIAHDFSVLGDETLKANLGMRYQKTDEVIGGLASPITALVWEGSADPTAEGEPTASPTWTQFHESYGYFLPALDLNLMVTDKFKVRFDASKTEDAPPDSQIVPSESYGGRVNALSSTLDNPDLLPYLADNFDLGAEWYYASNDYVSADYFYKKVTNFPTATVTNVTYPGIIDTAPCSYGTLFTDPTCGKLATFSQTEYTNSGSADVNGIEVIWQQMLIWGFGFQINGTYAHSNANFNPYVTTSNQFALPGVGSSANFIGFYQAHGLQARLAVQWQGSQLLQLGQEQTSGSFGSEPVNLASSTEVDFSTTYAIDPHVSLYFEALNLTDSVYHTYGRWENQTLNLVDYGRSYEFGVRAKM